MWDTILHYGVGAWTVLKMVSGALWGWALTLPAEVLLSGLLLSVAFIIWSWKVYGIAESLSGTGLTLLAILFVVIMFFLFYQSVA